MSPSVTVRRLAADDTEAHEAAVEVLRRGFLDQEAVCSAYGVSKSPKGADDLMDMVRAALKDGVSMGAYLDGVMVSTSINKIQVTPPAGEMSFFERFAKETATDPTAIAVLDFMLRVDSKCDLFALAGGEPMLELTFLGTVPEAGKRGAGLAVAAESLKVAREVGAKGVSALWTSDFSRAIGRRLGFQELLEVGMDEFVHEGRRLSELLPPHQQRTIVALFKID